MSDQGKTVFFVASDAGGMRNVIPVADLHAQQGGHSQLIVDTASPIPGEFDLSSTVEVHDVNDGRGADLFMKSLPGGLVVGTTGGPSLERTLTELARDLDVPSIAVLDEWYNYALRFRDAGGSWNLPDRIAAMNEMAMREARLEGIPENALFCSGSVWLSELATKSSRTGSSGTEGHDPVQVTFISENFTSESEEIPGMPYDENGVLRDVIAALDSVGQECRLINKVHPSRHDDHDHPEGTRSVIVETHARGSLLDFIRGSDLCIGMKSMGLLEASMLGVPVLSYQPGVTPESNISSAVRLGVCPMVNSRESLTSWLKRPWRAEPVSSSTFDFVSSSAPHSILNELHFRS